MEQNALKSFACQEYYRDWASFLNDFLQDCYLERAQSFDRETLYLQFAKKNFRSCIEIKFCDGYLLIFRSLRDLGSTNSQKGQLQFKEIENAKLKNVIHIENDRLLYLYFHCGVRLWLKGFGKFSNVLLQEYDNISNCWINTPSQIFRLGNKSDWDFEFNIVDIPNGKSVTENSEILISKWEESSSVAFKSFVFNQQKLEKLKKTDQRIHHLQKIKRETETRLTNLVDRRSNKEIGDLILAHAHSLKPGLSKALVTDYYTQQRIWIKLNPDLSAADNAKKYYGKAKNEVIEKEKLSETLETTRTNLEKLQNDRILLASAQHFKELKQAQIDTTAKRQDTAPYREFSMNGFTIWIGKNSKSNDELLRISSKNDLWLHAKDATGSHVIIRKKGLVYPKEIIEYAGKLAAMNSKAKTQAVVPIIYTLRKFVSKIKGGLPGQVSVQKEEILDIYLK